MKKLLFIIIIITIHLSLNAQMRYQLDKSRNETSWFVGINAGATSYYGNLAVFNRDPLLKLQKESKFAYGLIAGKSFNRFLGARGYFIRGGFQSQNNDLNVIYNAQTTSFGGQFIIQFATLIGRMDYVPNYALYGIAGAGMTNAKPELRSIPDDDNPNGILIDSLNYANQASGIHFNIGLGGSYEVFNQVDVNVEIIYNISMADDLDLVAGSPKDHFMYLSLGAIYRFGFSGHKKTSAFGRRRW